MKLQDLHEAMDDLHALHEFPGGWIHHDGTTIFNKYEEGEDPHQVEDHAYNAYTHFQDEADSSDADDMVDATHDIAWSHGWIKFAVSPIYLFASWDTNVTPQAIEGLRQLMTRAEKVRPNLKYEFSPTASKMHKESPALTRDQALEYLSTLK